MILKKQVIGSQAYLALEGAIVTVAEVPHTVGKGYKPALGDAPYADWASLGEIKDLTLDPKVTSEDVMAPSPGAYQRTDEVVTSRSLDLSLSLQDVSPLLFESLMLGKPDDDGDYLIGSGTGKIRGWLKVQQYDQGDVVRNVFDVFISGQFKSVKMENKLIVATLEAKVLYTPLGTGTLTFA